MTQKNPAAIVLLTLLTACSANTSQLPHAPAHAMAAVTVLMHWPARSARTAARNPQWISPSTASIAVEVNGDPSLTTKIDNPSSGQPVTSSVTAQAPPGNDSITFSLFDAPGATGNELGQVTVTQTIKAGAANTISAAVNGIASSVVIQPLPNQGTVASSVDATGTTTYTLEGDLPVVFTENAKDADGNVILDSTGMTYDVKPTNSDLAVTPVNGQPNEFTVRLAKPPAAGSSAGLLAHAVDALGNIAQSNYPVALKPLMYVAYKNAGAGAIAAIDPSGSAVALPGSFPGVKQPLNVAYDAAGHRLFVLEASTSQILAFNTDGTPVTSGYSAPTVSGATNLMFDYNNSQLYVTSSANTVSVFNADGSTASVAGTFPNLNKPAAITLYDANPAFFIFIANAGNNSVSSYNEDGTPAFFGPMRRQTFSLGTLVPAGVSSDGQGDWVVSGNAGGTGTIAQYGLFGVQFASLTAGVSGPANTAFNAIDGNCYLADSGSGNVTSYDPYFAGLLQTIASPAGLSAPAGMAFVY